MILSSRGKQSGQDDREELVELQSLVNQLVLAVFPH